MSLSLCLSTGAWCRYVVTVLARPVEAQWQRNTKRRIYRSSGLTAEILWQDLHPMPFYRRGGGFLNPLLSKMEKVILLSLCSNSCWGNPESHASDTCITPGGNMFAQCTRQLILSMSSALGGRMKQRFDLIGYEKGLTFGPSWESGVLRGEAFGACKDRCTELWFICLTLIFPWESPVWLYPWVSRINTH